jgi:hypothetical protein
VANTEGAGGLFSRYSPLRDWRCSYCQAGWWWLSASPSGAGSHSRPTPRTPQPLSKPHRLTQQRTKLSTPTGAPSTASSGVTIAIASEREVGGVSFAGYPIVELARSAFGNTSAEIDMHSKTSCASQATTPNDFISGGKWALENTQRAQAATRRSGAHSCQIAGRLAMTQRDSLVRRLAASPPPPYRPGAQSASTGFCESRKGIG